MAEQSNPMLIEAGIDLPELLAQIAEGIPGAESDGEWVRIRRHSLRATVAFGEMRRMEEMHGVRLLLIVQHPWFDEDLVESFEGAAPTPEAAMRIAVRRACEEVLSPLVQAFAQESAGTLTADVYGRRHVFRVPACRPVIHRGAGEPTDLYALVQDELPRYLGTKHCYWVDLTMLLADGVPACEVRINGTAYPDLTDCLYREALARRKAGGLVTDRQFLLLIQEDATRRPCPFTKQEVGELAFHALRLFRDITDEASAMEAYRALREAAPSHALYVEAAAFLPEIVAQQVVQLRDCDGIRASTGEGDPGTLLMKSQVRSYGYLADAVFQFLQKTRPSEDDIRQLLAMSDRFHRMTDAIEAGASAETIRLPEFVYYVDDNYEVW